MAGLVEAFAIPASDVPPWSVLEDPIKGHVVARFPPHVSSRIALATIEEIANVLRKRGQPSVVVADLFDVERFDPIAPIHAIIASVSLVRLIERVDLIVQRRAVRIAALTAARTLRLACTVRSRREEVL